MRPLNQYHRTVCRWLDEMDVGYVEEYPVGQYTIDIYLPDMKMGVEIDGPQHVKKEDIIRDHLILTTTLAGVDQIVRVKVGTKKELALRAILKEHYPAT
jgi:very-short-patch-repair endonuclease